VCVCAGVDVLWRYLVWPRVAVLVAVRNQHLRE
jgi:hypothetical protein